MKPPPQTSTSLVVALVLALAMNACGGSDFPTPADLESVGEDSEPVPRGPGGVVGFVDVNTVDAELPDFNILVDGEELGRMRRNPSEDIELEVQVEFEGQVFDGVTLQLHGGTARTFAKKSYRLTFDDDRELPVDFFEGRAPDEYRRLVFNASVIDPSFVGNWLTSSLIRRAGGLAPYVAFATLSFNGQVGGLYVVTERIDRQYLAREGLEPSGNVYKAVNHNANWASKSDPMAGFEHKLGEGPTDALGEMLRALSNTPADHQSFVEAVEPKLDLGDFMAFNMVHTFADNRDTYTKNYYLYHDTRPGLVEGEGRFRIFSWDADATFGVSWDGLETEARQTLWHGTDRFSPRLFSIPEYRQQYRARYLEALDTYLSAPALARDLAVLRAEIEPYAKADLALWQADADFATEMERVETFASERPDEMRQVVDGL